jgi:outer membrane protein TolC
VAQTIDVHAKLVEGGRILAPLRFVCEAFGGVVAWNPDTYVATVTTTSETAVPTEPVPAIPTEITLPLQQAVDLAVKNNQQVLLAQIDRIKKQNHHLMLPEQSDLEGSYMESAFAGKRAIYLAPKIAERQKQQAEQIYEITINGVKIQAESAFYELIKARENEQIASNALQRADEQLRMANSKYAVGTVARIEVIQNEAVQAAARAALTSAQTNRRQKMLELNKVIGLDMATVINPSGVFEFKAEEFTLQLLLDEAGQEAMSIITAQNNADIAQWNYEAYVDYYGSNNQDAQLAKEDVSSANVLLEQAKNNIVSAVNQSYSNFKSLEEQYQYLLKAVELSQEAYRLQKLSYDVGMTTFENVQKASNDLQKAEATLSECIFAYNTIKSSMKYSIYQ